jgi:hypothetical protein
MHRGNDSMAGRTCKLVGLFTGMQGLLEKQK